MHLTGLVDWSEHAGRTIPFPNGERNVRILLQGIHKVRKRLSNGEYRIYYYAWRGGPRIDGAPGSPEFIHAYGDAHASRAKPPQGVLFSLIAEFKSSAEFLKLAPKTRKTYLAYVKLIEDAFGDMPLAALDQPEVRGEFMRWRDTMSATPRKADYAWTVLARILSLAKNRGRIKFNHCERGGRLYGADRADKVWGEDEITRFVAVCGRELRTAMVLALWTGQRQGDLLRLPWSSFDGRYIRLRQSKTGRKVVIPVASRLREELAAIEKRGPLILVNSRSRPWTSDGFRSSWTKARDRAGIAGLTFHDIRGSAVVRLALAGATVPEIATFTGHSLKDVESILDAHYLGRDVKLADSAIKKLSRNEKRPKTVNRL